MLKERSGINEPMSLLLELRVLLVRIGTRKKKIGTTLTSFVIGQLTLTERSTEK